jgi:hypothetical protein
MGIQHHTRLHVGIACTATISCSLRSEGRERSEIANQYPDANNLGASPDSPGAEQIWDEVLSRGTRIWGVASDDTHVLKDPLATNQPLPGRGWIVVRAAHLTVDGIVGAIRAGDFYASTGVQLNDYQASEKQIAITIRPGGDRKYRVEFIGKNGHTLQETTGTSAIYITKGDEGYVRAKIVDSDGKMAWTQPVFLKQ